VRPRYGLGRARDLGNSDDLRRIGAGGAMLVRQLLTERTGVTVES
jgi:hypothetical protein